MEFTKVISPELIKRKFNESITFGKKIYETFPEIERMLNSAWKGVKVRPQITLALSEKWIGIENLKAEKYAVAVVKLDWKPDANSKTKERKEIRYSDILTREFADKLISDISGTQFKCEVIEGRNNIIGGFRITDLQSGLRIDVTRKSVLDCILSDSDRISYVTFNSERVELLQLLRVTEQPKSQQAAQEPRIKGPNCSSLERTITNVSALIDKLVEAGSAAETFNSMRKELEAAFKAASDRYPDRMEEILEKAWRLTDGTIYDRLLVTKYALRIVLHGKDLDTGFKRLESLERQGIKGIDLAVLSPAMANDLEAVFATIDFGTARIDVDTYLSNNGPGTREAYVQVKEALEEMAKLL